MEVVAFLCMAVVFGLIGLLPFLAVAYSIFAPRNWGRRWATAASDLGLTLDPFEPAHNLGVFVVNPNIRQPMRGSLAGIEVSAVVRVVRSTGRRNRSRQYFTRVSAKLPASLRVGAHVNARRTAGQIFDAVLGTSDLKLGDSRLDPHYDIRAIEPEYFLTLLRSPPVHGVLAGNLDSPWRLILDDQHVTLETRGRELDAPMLRRPLERVAEMATQISAAATALGPSPENRAVDQGMAAVAARWQLSHDRPGARVAGRVEGMYVEVEAVVRQSTRKTVFRTRFDRPLGLTLSITREGTLSSIGKVFGMQDIVVGDPDFDRRFVVKGTPEAAVRAAMTPDVRAKLVDLDEKTSELVVKDDHVEATVAWLIHDEAQLELGMVTVARAGAAVAQVSPHRPGPFRG